MSKSGVYTIQNTKNGKLYVGSAANFKSRWAKHRHHLRNGTHHNAHLQAAWSKYGETAFVFKVVVLSRPEDAVVYEQIAFEAFRPAYNKTPVAGNTLGYKMTPEQKAKVRKAAAARVRQNPVAHDEKTAAARAAWAKKRSNPEVHAAWLEQQRKHIAARQKRITYNGVTDTVRGWAAKLGVHHGTLADRVLRWGVDVALSTPAAGKHSPEAMLLRNTRRGAPVLVMDGQPCTVTAVAAALSLSRDTVRRWHLSGLSVDQMRTKQKAR